MTEQLKEAAYKHLEKSEFIKYLDLELLEITDDFVCGRIPFTEKFYNPYKTMHGGCLYALADTVAGTLANMGGKLVTTVEGSLHFLEPAWKTEYIYCEAKLIRTGGHLVTVAVEIKDDNSKLLDYGTFIFFKSTVDTTQE